MLKRSLAIFLLLNSVAFAASQNVVIYFEQNAEAGKSFSHLNDNRYQFEGKFAKGDVIFLGTQDIYKNNEFPNIEIDHLKINENDGSTIATITDGNGETAEVSLGHFDLNKYREASPSLTQKPTYVDFASQENIEVKKVWSNKERGNYRWEGFMVCSGIGCAFQWPVRYHVGYEQYMMQLNFIDGHQMCFYKMERYSGSQAISHGKCELPK